MRTHLLRNLGEKLIHHPQAFISRDEALALTRLEGDDIVEGLALAHRLTMARRPGSIFTCAIMNAKSGRCSQDCAFCAQSIHHPTGIPTYPLRGVADMVDQALRMEASGANCFSMVTSGERLTNDETSAICAAADEIRAKTRLEVCASLGLLTPRQADRLKQSGLTRYHHNLETAESFYHNIRTTRTYQEDIDTLRIAGEAGLSVCAGGIFGMGETWGQRVELAFTLKSLGVDRVPINFLHPIPGTRLASLRPLFPMEALKTIALFRFILPDADLISCGGREPTLKDYQSFIFMAGANGVMIGNYLTTRGRDMDMDMEMINTWRRLQAPPSPAVPAAAHP